jgi:hypothetical protein
VGFFYLACALLSVHLLVINQCTSGGGLKVALVVQRQESVAGWSSLVARWAHNPKVVGSNPAPATNEEFALQALDQTAAA